MIRLVSRHSVRHAWPAYVGAFVALTFGVVLIGLAVTLIGAVEATSSTDGVTAAERAELDGLSSLFGTMSAVAMFMALFVVGSTFGFVVASRRRELGLLRLVGATPRQVRRVVLGESAVVAAAATVVGCLVSTAVAPGALWLVRVLGVTDLHLAIPSPWLAWAIAAPCGAVVALLGCWRSSRRASRVPPVAALREAGVERSRPGVVALLVATCCLGAVVATVAVANRIEPLFALVVAILLPEVIVIGLMCLGPVLIPRVASALARPFVGRDVSARVARDELRAGVRATASVAAPVVAISAIAGSMVLTLSFTVDWTSSLDRAQLAAPFVVRGVDGSTEAAVTGDPTVSLVDARRQVPVRLGPEREMEQVEAVDVDTAVTARGLRAVRGDLDDLHGSAVAATETWVLDSGTGLGESVRADFGGGPVRLRVAAVVPDAPDLYGDLVVPLDAVPQRFRETVPSELFVMTRSGVPAAEADTSLGRTLAGTEGEVLTAEEWIDDVSASTRRANNLGLVVLLGPAGLYAAIAIVNATLIGAAQRRRQHELVHLLGATPDQVRRSAVWQSAFVTGAGLLLGGLTTGFLGWLVRHAIGRDLAGTGVDVPMTVPWLPLGAIAATCAGLALAAALAGVRGHTPVRAAAITVD